MRNYECKSEKKTEMIQAYNERNKEQKNYRKHDQTFEGISKIFVKRNKMVKNGKKEEVNGRTLCINQIVKIRINFPSSCKYLHFLSIRVCSISC